MGDRVRIVEESEISGALMGHTRSKDENVARISPIAGQLGS